MQYAIVYTPGPSWNQIASQLATHEEYLTKLRALQKLLQISRSKDGKSWVVVLEVKDEAEARRLLGMDPAVIDRILNAELHLWHIVFGLNAAASIPTKV